MRLSDWYRYIVILCHQNSFWEDHISVFVLFSEYIGSSNCTIAQAPDQAANGTIGRGFQETTGCGKLMELGLAREAEPGYIAVTSELRFAAKTKEQRPG
jgi:hypothetical protein